jgi:hypothetical protein
MLLCTCIGLAIVLYGCETWSFILWEECRLLVFENRVLRRAFGPKRDEVTWIGENYIMRNFMISTFHPIFLGDIFEKNMLGGTCSAYWVGERCSHSFSKET